MEFRLAAVDGGTEPTVVESSFEQIPPTRRATAFRMNAQGRTEQARRIRRRIAESGAG